MASTASAGCSRELLQDSFVRSDKPGLTGQKDALAVL